MPESKSETVASGVPPASAPATWTAVEVFSAIAPHRVSTLTNPSEQLNRETRRAHVIAVMAGIGWNRCGRYPLGVWMKLR